MQQFNILAFRTASQHTLQADVSLVLLVFVKRW